MQPALNLSLSQKVAMTPQLAESIRFLQLSAEELAEELKTALEENVMLERVDGDSDAEELMPVTVRSEESASWQDGGQVRGQVSDDFDPTELLVQDEAGVHLRILDQARQVLRKDALVRIAIQIIDATDDSGYLRRPLAELVDEAGIGATLAGHEHVLRTLQRLEPVGFAARSLSECLDIQLEELPAWTPGRELARDIVSDHMQSLGRMALDEIAATLAVEVDDVADAVRLIRSLNPKPAANEGLATAVVPDVTVSGDAAGWVVSLNQGAVPNLRINPDYERVVTEDASAKALRGQLQEARWLLRSVEMRNDTLLRATRYIFEQQQDFLARGETALRPLTLKSVADAIGVHESTISRITTSKYVQTPHGIYSLKKFFPSTLVTAEGVAASGAAVQAMIQKLISRESAEEPLRDVDIAAILARRGVKIARRTIAKYREALGIASSKERQEQYRLRTAMQRHIYRAPLARLAS